MIRSALPSALPSALRPTLLALLLPMAAVAQTDPFTYIGLVDAKGWHVATGQVAEQSFYENPYQPGAQSMTATASFSTWDERAGRIAGGMATSTATADFGALHVVSSTTSLGEAHFEAYGSAFFLDWFTVTGAPGQWVTLSWTASLHGVRACSTGSPAMESGALASYDFSFSNLSDGLRGVGGYLSLNACGDQRQDATGMLSALVGERIQVTGNLRAFAKNGDVMDAGQTARVFFDVLTPGAGMVSASGHNYAITAVPEPGPATLFALGAAGLAVALRRQRARAA